MTGDPRPPQELTGARVIAYAVLDSSVTYTGRLSLFVDGKSVDPVPRLAIAQNNYEPSDFLLLYCDEAWDVIGAGGYSSVSEAKDRAEVAYAGVSSRWQQAAQQIGEGGLPGSSSR